MHELSLVESILQIIDEYAAKEGFSRVTALSLSCGKLSCVVPQALSFAFEVQSKGTRAEGAALELEVLPAAIHCLACGRMSRSSASRPSASVQGVRGVARAGDGGAEAHRTGRGMNGKCLRALGHSVTFSA